MADKKAQLIIEGLAPVDLPVLTGTIGPDVIDVRDLILAVISLTTPVLCQQQHANLKSLISMVIKGFYCTAAIQLSN